MPAGCRLSQQRQGTNVNKLQQHFPKRAEELRKLAVSGSNSSGTFEEISEEVWTLSQLWLTFLDGDDLGFTVDSDIYRQIVDLANSSPRCSIEEEAVHWMLINAVNMSEPEIELALWCAVDRVGTILVLNGNFDETRQMLVEHRNRHR